MGVLNVTPDSFSDGGKFFEPETAVAHAERMINEGADIIDIGGESTRPYSEPVPAEEETARVVPVIEHLAETINVPISIDTTKAEVARRAINAGASIINDVSALRFDPEMAGAAAELGVPVILMHMKGNPKTMQVAPEYKDVIMEIISFIENAIILAEKNGIQKEKIIVDPGIGFGKTFEHNLILLKKLNEFITLDMPILVGPSRKAFIRNILKENDEDEVHADSPVVEAGTQAAIAAAVLNGAHMVRVHDVAGTRVTLKVVDAVINAGETT